MMSDTSYTTGLYNSRICSKPALIRLPMLKISRIEITMAIDGNVMRMVCCSLLAPSMIADSYSSGFTPASAARMMIVPQPISFHTWVATSTLRK